MNGHEWVDYFAVHKDRAPRPFLLDVLAQWSSGEGHQAIDLGCGPGSETLAMLSEGWRVLAVDAEAEAIDILVDRVPAEHRSRLQTVVASFDAVPLPRADLVHAGFSLPFCPPERFPTLWQAIRTAVSPGGRFAGQLFGDRDSWRGSPDMTFLHRDEARALIDGWHVEVFDEIDEDGAAVTGPKHWHLWHVVAQRPSA